MAANTEKIKTCFRAVTMFLRNLLTLRCPLWLFIVAVSVAVLFSWLVSCSAAKNSNGNVVDSAVVGYTEYHSHSYLVFYAAGSFSVVHDPDCICKIIEN